jgi:glycine cleavage system H protein
METRFTAEEEWVRLEGDIATVGITHHAQEQLGDLVFVQVPAVGAELAAHQEAGTVESVKAASEVYAPLAGTVVEVNEAIAGDPSIVNGDAEGAGWLFKLRIASRTEFDALLTEDAYRTLAK